MKKYLFLLMMLTSVNIYSQPTEKSIFDTESWYFQIALGYASTSYYDELQQIIDIIKEDFDKHLWLSFDIGFYWPFLMNDNMLLGGSLKGVGERFGNYFSGREKNWIQINQYLFGPSFKYYLIDYIGKGLFLKIDSGVGYANAINSDGDKVITDYGYGYLFGAGWAIPFNNETRMELFLDYSGKHINSESFYALTFNLGFLF